jgi:acetoin utilization deacetylase AcuC-like enzyme
MLPGQGDEEYRHQITSTLLVDFKKFEPEFILVSTGFDAHADDDMSDINLSTEWFTWMMKQIMEMSDNYCNGRMVSVLEGGYSLRRLPELARNHVEVLLDG